MRRSLLGFLLALSSVSPGMAQDAAAPPADAVQMVAVVVTGGQPGPGLWKVSKGDHVLWVLGTLSPLPKDMRWKSRDVEAVIATAQEVLSAPQIGLRANVGLFARLTLLPSLMGVRNNPGHEKLQDVVPPDLYARWSVLKQKYIGRSNKVEKWRPIFAALELYDAAIERAGLGDPERMQKTVLAAAQRAGIEPTPVQVIFAIDDPQAAIKAFKRTAFDDLDCFHKTLDRIDDDLGAMTARANAWATADLEALRRLPYTDQMRACMEAVTETSLLRSRGISDVGAQVEKAWLDAATAALDRNAVSFALLPIRQLLAADGYLSKLCAQGCTVEAPDAAETGAGPTEDAAAPLP